MSGAAYIDKRGREPGSGLIPDKKGARAGVRNKPARRLRLACIDAHDQDAGAMSNTC